MYVFQYNIVWICMILKFRGMELYFWLLPLLFHIFDACKTLCKYSLRFIILSQTIRLFCWWQTLGCAGPWSVCRLCVAAAPVHTLTSVHQSPHSHQHFSVRCKPLSQSDGCTVMFHCLTLPWWSDVFPYNYRLHSDEVPFVHFSVYLIFALCTYSVPRLFIGCKYVL